MANELVPTPTQQPIQANQTTQTELPSNDFLSYASNSNVNVNFNPNTNTLTINGVPVNVSKSGLTYQGGQLTGSVDAYNALLSPFINAGTKQADVYNEMQNFQPYETPEEYRQLMLGLIEQANQKYQWNFDESPMVAQARDTLEKSISDLASAHGFLYSGGTQQIIEAQLKSLAPAFEEAEYAKHRANMEQQLAFMQTLTKWDAMQYDRSMDKFALIQQKANFIQSLSEMEFNKFKIMLQQHRDEQEIALAQEQFDLQKLKFETDSAYERIANTGYVDNESAKVLGVPAGTPARWVQELELEHQNKIDLMKKENEYNISMANEQAKIEKDIVAYQTELEVASKLKLMEADYQYQSRLTDLKFVNQQELDRLEAERKAAEDAAKAAAKAKEEANKPINMTWGDLKKRFTTKFDTDKDGYLDEGMEQEAAAWAIDELARGVSEKLIDQLILTYDIPEYTGKGKGTSYSYKSSYEAAQNRFTPKTGPVKKSTYGLTGTPLF